MLGERVRPTFGQPQKTHAVELVKLFPDAKLKIVPRGGWMKYDNGQRKAPVGLYNGSINPTEIITVSEELWEKIKDQLPTENKESNKLELPEWTVLVTSKANFGIDREKVLEDVDFSSSGNLQTTFEFSPS